MNQPICPIDSKSLIRQSAVCLKFGMTRSGLSKIRERHPDFPKPIKFGDSRQAAAYFVLEEVEAWLEARMAERGAS